MTIDQAERLSRRLVTNAARASLTGMAQVPPLSEVGALVISGNSESSEAEYLMTFNAARRSMHARRCAGRE